MRRPIAIQTRSIHHGRHSVGKLIIERKGGSLCEVLPPPPPPRRKGVEWRAPLGAKMTSKWIKDLSITECHSNAEWCFWRPIKIIITRMLGRWNYCCKFTWGSDWGTAHVPKLAVTRLSYRHAPYAPCAHVLFLPMIRMGKRLIHTLHTRARTHIHTHKYTHTHIHKYIHRHT